MNRERWLYLRPHLDRALDLPAAERGPVVTALETDDPAAARDLREMLASYERLDSDGFLEREFARPEAPAARPDRTGMRAGAYTIERLLGRGGMGEVWLASRHDGRFEGRCALKFLEAATVRSAATTERFEREGRFLARLDHPNVARLLDAGTLDSQPYLALEYVEGDRIDDYCVERKLSIDARVRLFLDVAAAVAHAHSQLVVHRDLKPSNVLVTSSGQVKLLDFGIAKLVEPEPGDGDTLTQHGELALTPEYAAPEQLRGGESTTATDVYQLGLLLYVLLVGKHPWHEAATSRADRLARAREGTVPRASEATAGADRRSLRGELDAILAMALREAPADRYATAAAFGDDLRRYLEGEPVVARRGARAYRVRKFVRRHRWGVSAAALVGVALAAGMFVVNRERALAERRFGQVRQLANKLFDIDIAVRQVPGATAARQVIVNTALDYLSGLSNEVEGDPDLALDVGTAYMRVGRVQGVPISANLGQSDVADATLATAERLIASVLRAEPTNRVAMLRAAQIAHDRMILAGERRPADQALVYARASSGWLDGWAKSAGPVPEWRDVEQALIVYNNVGNRFRVVRDFESALRRIGQGVELARTVGTPDAERQEASLLIVMTRIHRDRGDLDEALRTIREAEAKMEGLGPEVLKNAGPRNVFVLMLNTEGEVLAQANGPSLGRPAEALVPLRRGFDIMDEAAHMDAANAQFRSNLAAIGRVLADCLVETDPAGALAVHDHVLRHLAEVKDNPRSRRDEARALAASTFALRRLGRAAEVRRRLDLAFQRLAALKLLPADTVDPDSEADHVLSASAEAEAADGQTAAAIATYESLLTRVLASEPESDVDLGDAASVSRLFNALSRLHASAGHDASAAAYRERSRQLWQGWARRLPGNPFVARQLGVTQ